MNPLISVSFSSQTAVPSGGGRHAATVDIAADTSGKPDQFGRFLSQSGEQQATDRQSFAGSNLANKTKRLASLEGATSARPEITLPPVLPPEAELTAVVNSAADNNDADEKNAAILLGLLDLASQAKQQLAAQADAKGQGSAKAEAKPATDDAAAADIAASLEKSDDKKSVKGDWTILPVYPELAGADVTATKRSQLKPEHSSASKIAAAGELAAQAVANQAVTANPGSVKPAMAAQQVAADNSSKPASGSAVASADNELASTDLNMAKGAAQSSDASNVAPAEAELLAEQATVASRGSGNPQPAAEFIPKGEPTTSATSQAGIQQSQAAATIFAKPMATIFDTQGDTDKSDSGKSAAASSLASAAAVADSAQARQQQRAGLADAANLTKQALAAGAEAADSSSKADGGAVAGSQRAESSLSGFSSIFNQASQNQSETVAARLDAATVASTQQSAERAKAQNVSKSVTEQLKQVNLLAQNAAGQLKERVNLMVRQNIQVAEIRLDPADLGQMQIRVNLQQEQATVQFIVQQQHAKELLEQQMPRLREMLQQQGIQLGEGQVQQQRQGDSQAGSQRNSNAGAGHGDGQQHADEQATALQLEVKLSERLVDYYA